MAGWPGCRHREGLGWARCSVEPRLHAHMHTSCSRQQTAYTLIIAKCQVSRMLHGCPVQHLALQRC